MGETEVKHETSPAQWSEDDTRLFSRTGNPFVDNGLAALCILTEKSVPEEITRGEVRKQIEFLSKMCNTNEWKNQIHGMLFPNAELASFSMKNGPAKYRQRYFEYCDKATPIGGIGNCTICGNRDGIPVNKTRVPLFASMKFVNFFPGGSLGERVCPNCLIAVQFVMLAIEKVGRPLMLHTSNWTIQKAYVKRNLNEVKRRDSSGKGGIADFEYSMPAGLNAAYDAILAIIQESRIKAMPAGDLVAPLRFYHFTNFGQNPDVSFYDIPSSVFSFLLEVEKHNRSSDWKRVVQRGYVQPKKQASKDITKTTENRVYRALTDGKSIVGFFFEDKKFTVIGDWELISFYLKKVRSMDEKRIDVIREVADRFLEFCKDSGTAKRIVQLHYARSYREFRSILLKVQEASVKKMGRPLITYDEYVLDLAPEGGQNWSETRDLILFRVYEQGASWLTTKRDELEEIEELDE